MTSMTNRTGSTICVVHRSYHQPVVCGTHQRAPPRSLPTEIMQLVGRYACNSFLHWLHDGMRIETQAA